MKPEQITATVQGLRELADFLESNPELPTTGFSTIHFFLPYFPNDDREAYQSAMRQWAKAFGTFEKMADELYFTLRRQFSGFAVEVTSRRENVCRKVTKLVEKEFWECPESLLAPELPAEAAAE